VNLVIFDLEVICERLLVDIRAPQKYFGYKNVSILPLRRHPDGK